MESLQDFSLRNAYTLYTQLLAPFAETLKASIILSWRRARCWRTCVQPAGQRRAVRKRSYADAAWLVRRMALSQVPSPRAFVSLRQAERIRHAAPRPFLGLGDPLLSGADSRSGGTAALQTLAVSCREASPMPPALLRALAPCGHRRGSQKRAQALGGDADSMLLGAAASETGLRSRPLDQYRVAVFRHPRPVAGELHCQAEPAWCCRRRRRRNDHDGDGCSRRVKSPPKSMPTLCAVSLQQPPRRRRPFRRRGPGGTGGCIFNAGAGAVPGKHWEVPSPRRPS